jgi:type III secretory pathway component EscV
MARELTRQIGRLYGIPVVYLLDRPIVEILASGQVLSVELEESVLEAIHREMRQLPVGASSPCLLAPANLRRRLRALTREEFPNTPVVTYAELAPDFSVQPVARVS